MWLLVLVLLTGAAWAEVNEPVIPFVRNSAATIEGNSECIIVFGDLQSVLKATSCTPQQWDVDDPPCHRRQVWDAMIADAIDEDCALVIQVGDFMSTVGHSIIETGSPVLFTSAHESNVPINDPNGLLGLNDPNGLRVEAVRMASLVQQFYDAGIPFLFSRGNHDLYEWTQGVFRPSPDPLAVTVDWSTLSGVEYKWNDTGCLGGVDKHNYNWNPWPNDPNGLPYLTDNCNDTYAVRVDMGGWHLVVVALSPGMNQNEHAWVDTLLTDVWPNHPILWVGHANFDGTFSNTFRNGFSSGHPAEEETLGSRSKWSWREFPSRAAYTQRSIGLISGHFGISGIKLVVADPDSNSLVVTTDNTTGVIAHLFDLQAGITLYTERGSSTNNGGEAYSIWRFEPDKGDLTIQQWSSWHQVYEYDPSGFIQSPYYHDSNFPYVSRYGLILSADARTTPTREHQGKWSMGSLSAHPKPATGIDSDVWLELDGATGWQVPAASQAAFAVDPNSPVVADKDLFASLAYKCSPDTRGSPMCLFGVGKGDGSVSQWLMYIDAAGDAHSQYGNVDLVVGRGVCDNKVHIQSMVWGSPIVGRTICTACELGMYLDNAINVAIGTDLTDGSTWSDNTEETRIGVCHDGAGGAQNYFTGSIRQLAITRQNSWDYGAGLRKWITPRHGFTLGSVAGLEELATRDIRGTHRWHEILEWWPVGHPNDTATSIIGSNGVNLELVPRCQSC